jgi:hypothetical protein
MSDSPKSNSSSASDEDLLAGAIPIEEEDEDDESASANPSSSDNEDELTPIDIAESDAPSDVGAKSKRIHALGERRPHEDSWKRKPNVTGQGAIHVKTFIAKLRYDAIEHLDEQVNHWLDAHPEYEVKFVTTTVGTLRGKLLEEALFVNIWV